MKYFKNTELAKLYKVSEKSVRNWIDAAEAGKLNLALHEVGNRRYIANTAANTFQVGQLAQKGQKYRNTRGFKAIAPTPAFYEQFSSKEIYDIITSIDIHREVPHKYAYFAEGAKVWDAYAKKMAYEEFPNSLTNTIGLVELSESYLDAHLAGASGVNVVDIGVGNALPVKPLLKHLLDRGLMRRYIAIDASDEMLDIAEQNVEDWFGDKIHVERAIQDANYDRFDELLAGDTFNKDNERIVNLVLFLGGTIANLMDPDLALRVMGGCLGKNDLFLLSRKLDTPEARRFFDFSGSAQDGKLVDKEKFVLDLMGIDESLYSVEQYFDAERLRRVIQIRLKVDISVTFQLEDKHRTLQLRKGDTVLVWHASHSTLAETIEQFNRNGLDIMQTMRSIDGQYAQVIAKIKTE